jgi:hypothetical protein
VRKYGLAGYGTAICAALLCVTWATAPNFREAFDTRIVAFMAAIKDPSDWPKGVPITLADYPVQFIGMWCASLLGVVFFSQLVLVQLARWRATVKLYGQFPLRMSLLIVRLNFRRRHWWLFIFFPVIASVFFVLIPVAYPAIVYLPLIIVQVGILLSAFLPPAILLLASSNWEAARLFILLDRGAWPYRTVVLFEPDAVQPRRHSIFSWQQFTQSNLRLRDDRDWHHQVGKIADTAPLIIVDTRIASAGVILEIQRIFTAGLLQKTLFVANDDGSAPAFAAARFGRQPAPENAVRFWDVIERIKARKGMRVSPVDEDPAIRRKEFLRSGVKFGKAMTRIDHSIRLLGRAVARTERSRGRDHITRMVADLIRQLNGNPGDASPEIFEHLGADIAATNEAIDELAQAPSAYRLIGYRLLNLCGELCALQHHVDNTPPAIWQDHLEYLKSLKAERPGGPNPPVAPAPPRRAAEPVPPAAAAPSSDLILKSGIVDGMAYRLYTDGSIDADLPQGMLRFKSIADLRGYLEQDS